MSRTRSWTPRSFEFDGQVQVVLQLRISPASPATPELSVSSPIYPLQMTSWAVQHQCQPKNIPDPQLHSACVCGGRCGLTCTCIAAAIHWCKQPCWVDLSLSPNVWVQKKTKTCRAVDKSRFLCSSWFWNRGPVTIIAKCALPVIGCFLIIFFTAGTFLRSSNYIEVHLACSSLLGPTSLLRNSTD